MRPLHRGQDFILCLKPHSGRSVLILMTHQILLVLYIPPWKPNNEKLSTKTWLFLKNTIWTDLQRQIFLWTQWFWTAMLCFQISLHFIFSQLSWNNIWYRKNISDTHRQKNSQPSETTGPLHLYCFCNKYSLSHRIPSKRSSGDLKIQANHCHATLNAFIFISIKFPLLMDQSYSAATNLHIQPASCWGASGHKIHEYIKSEKGN